MVILGRQNIYADLGSVASGVSRRRVMVGLVFVQIFFATLPVAGKIGLREFSSPALALLRVSVAAVIFTLIHGLTVREKIHSRRDYLRLAWYSVLGVSLNQLLYITGLNMTTATAAQMLITGGPAVTLLIAIMAGKESATPAKWFGIVLAATGALVLVGVGATGSSMLGNILILVNMVAYSIYLVSARDLLQTYHPLTVVKWIFIFGVAGLMPFGILRAIQEWPLASTDARLALLWIIIFPTICAYYLNMWALTVVESSLVSTFVYLQPIMTAALAIPILGERPSLRMVPAAVLIFSGVGISIWSARRRDHRPHPEDQAIIET